MTGKALHDNANKVSLPTDREKTIRGLMQSESDAGRFEARFLRADFPDKDFEHFKLDMWHTISRDEQYTYIRW